MVGLDGCEVRLKVSDAVTRVPLWCALVSRVCPVCPGSPRCLQQPCLVPPSSQQCSQDSLRATWTPGASLPPLLMVLFFTFYNSTTRTHNFYCTCTCTERKATLSKTHQSLASERRSGALQSDWRPFKGAPPSSQAKFSFQSSTGKVRHPRALSTSSTAIASRVPLAAQAGGPALNGS